MGFSLFSAFLSSLGDPYRAQLARSMTNPEPAWYLVAGVLRAHQMHDLPAFGADGVLVGSGLRAYRVFLGLIEQSKIDPEVRVDLPPCPATVLSAW